ncbi:MAG: glycoside hydrolase family 36 protein [Myxococcales bacterium]|jgi:alpha-galactosidase
MPDMRVPPVGPVVVPTSFGTLSGYVRYRVGGEARLVVLPFEPRADLPDLTLETRLIFEEDRLQLAVTLYPSTPLELLEAKVELRLSPELHREVLSALSNGWQSWSLTRELDRAGALKPPSPLLWFLRPLGDAGFTRYGTGRGVFHSWSLTHLRLRGGFVFVGSTTEDSGFTLLRLDLQTGAIEAEKDCAGRRVAGEPFPLLGLHVARSPSLDTAADGWLEAAGIAPRPVEGEKAFGWTSWYLHYTNIDERLIRQSLDRFAGVGRPGDYFQIDDGYAPAVGDWLLPSAKFPHGMKALADEIHGRGFRAGLWLAPFVCEKRSRVFRDHPDWLLRDEHGIPVSAGWNPNWSGTYYALDLSRPAARGYVRDAVAAMAGEWGYDLIKADFLYAAAMVPTKEQTRGERMADALDLLREAVGDKALLACGVPLASAAGRVEYCRIGPDVSPYWEDRFLSLLDYGERVSTRSSLTNTINRAHLHRRLFANDPDVFILRRTKSKLTEREAQTLFVVNYLLSGILLFSDDPAAYGDEKQLLLRGFPMVTPERTEVTPIGDLYRVCLEHGRHRFLLLVNLGEREQTVALAPDELKGEVAFDQLAGELIGARDGLSASVPARGCRLFKISSLGAADEVVGTTCHLLGGVGDAVEVLRSADGLAVRVRDGLRARGRVVIGLAEGKPGTLISVNGTPRAIGERAGVRYVEAEIGPREVSR